MKVRGVVVEGKKLGRKLGFPTANVMISEGMTIENGVYRSCVEIEGVRHLAITNVGNNPTTGGEARRTESYILDFECDLYGKTLEIELISKIRDEMKFNSVEELREQIGRDIMLIND